MTPAHDVVRVTRRPRFLWLARRYVRSRMRSAFDGVFARGLSRIRALAERGPLILAANHVAWWDPLFAVLLDEALGTTGYALMDAPNLGRLPFFGWVGAIPIVRDDARRALAQLRASARLLSGPATALWIFPQGTQRPAHLRPLGVKSGVVRLAVEARAPVVPLALNYLFRQTSEPSAIASFGAPLDAEELGRRGLLDALERSLAEELAAIDVFATEGRKDFDTLIASRRSGDTPGAARLLATAALRRTDDGATRASGGSA
ncbi:MAG: lysophospholipid acyltransferase family protein [Deltaproteobacteria bacterium]|nr:lysophospholipid acyltransferase family protein [Deltaproteobacteria bacterium]